MRLYLFLLYSLCYSLSFAQVNVITLKTLDDKTITIETQNRITAVIFISPECPLCQNYTLTLNNLQAKYKKDGVRIIGVFPGQSYAIEDMKLFKRKYNIQFSLLRDPEQTLVKLLSATVTPEVFVIDGRGDIQYSGRIDNWAYEVSRKRRIITEHDLDLALQSLIHHELVKNKHTKAIGCFIE